MSISNQEQLLRYTRPTRSITNKQDIDYPFSFQDWSENYQSITPGQEYPLYNQYLTDWYKNKATTTTDKNLQIKLNYLNLLRQLQLFFKEDEIELWYEQINLENEKELLLAIPYFAKKLKDIALYYLNLRDNIKKSKIKYNLVGTNTGINLELQEFLLKNYTQKPNSFITIPASVWKSVPALSSIQDTINIQIEELYDTFQYLDHSPTLPVSAYYNNNFLALENYFESLGLALTSTEWVFKTGVFDVSGNQIVDTIKISEELSNKYLNNDKFTSLFYTTSTKTDLYNVSILQGNNFFYWPYGAYESNITDLPRYETLSLSAAGIENIATGGTSIEFADTIFVKTAQGIKGAWLKYFPFDISYPTMNAALYANTTTKFRFPFPGFGLSAETIDWTGFDLKTTPLFRYQPIPIKKQIENLYWSTNINLTSHDSIYLNSTSLIENKAYAATFYDLADKIRIWSLPPQYIEGAYSGTGEEAWLYKMSQTDISIASDKDTTIIWPYCSINNTDTYPFLPEDVNEACLPKSLSDIVFNFAIASDQLSGADMIFKINNYQDSKSFATEGAWLSGKLKAYSDSKIVAVQQPALNCLFTSGNFTQFIWQGEDLKDCNDVFVSLIHQPDCRFATTPNTTYKDYNLCTCRQVLFTPFGHPGDNYTDNAAYCDYLIEDPFNFSLDLSEWRGKDGKPASTSNGFAWFKTNSKIGFGDGRWVTGFADSFDPFVSLIPVGLKLRTGRSYLYFRQILRDVNTTTNTFPKYCVRHSYNNYNANNFKWIKATKNTNGDWINANTPSFLKLYSGENLLYSRILGPTFTNAQSALETKTINENRGSIWTNYDYLTVPDGYNSSVTTTTPQQFVLNYPLTPTLNTSIENQQPSVNISNNNFVKIVSWSVTYPNDTTYFSTAQSLTIAPVLTGLYTFSVTAMSASTMPPSSVFISGTTTFYYTNTGYYIFNNIPAVTALSGTTVVYPITSFTTPAPGFVINTPLYGWDYNTSTYTDNTIFGDLGARPFWATTANIKNIYTGYKGINAWGNYLRLIDDYNVIAQPEISQIQLNTGNYVEYERKADTDIVWNEELVQNVIADKNIWCTLNFNTTSITNLNDVLNNNAIELITIATSAASPLVLDSIVDDKPVEIFYNAINAFVWPVSAVPIITDTVYTYNSSLQVVNAVYPWANLPSRYYPNVAILPTIQNLSSVTDFGGFFVPQNLGATQYLNKDYTTKTVLSSPALTGIYENSNEYIGGRGLTKQDQLTPFEIITENSTWLKEPPISGPIAGNIKKNVFKKYQKFIPYQTRYESNPRYRYGITTPASRQTPWTGPTNSDWGDLQNYPVSYTGELNVDNWTNSQVLKDSNLRLDNWVTDIFGNQYGLYKNLNNIPPYDRKNILGTIWVRKNSQETQPASIALSGVFDTYKSIPFYNLLTGVGIKRIDTFFDTLYIETGDLIIFEKLNYDFKTNTIFSLADESRYISLYLPITTNIRDLSSIPYRLPTKNYNPSRKMMDSWGFISPSPLYSTSEYELYDPTLISDNIKNYIISVGGVVQISTNCTIDACDRVLQLPAPSINNVTGNIPVDIVQIFNPSLTGNYISTLNHWTTSFSTTANSFVLTNAPNLSSNTSHYFVTVNGLVQNPSTYTINNTTKSILFSEPIKPNLDIQVLYIPNLNAPITITRTTTLPTTTISVSGINNDSASAFIVAIGGVYQSPTTYNYNYSDQTIVFTNSVPLSTTIQITQLSIKDKIPSPNVYTSLCTSTKYAKAGETWFLPENKKVIISVCTFKNRNLGPELYEYSLTDLTLKKVFPQLTKDITTINTLSSLNLQTISTPLLTYNRFNKQYVLTIQGQSYAQQDILTEFIISDFSPLELKNVTVYTSKSLTLAQQNLPPIINQSLTTTQNYTLPLNITIKTQNGTATFSRITSPTWMSLTSAGVLRGTIPSPGVYTMEFVVNNNAGPSYYAYTVIAT